MATFPITRARQELGFTPSTAVRADIDVRTGEGAVGAAIGQALLQVGRLGIEYHLKQANNQLSESQREAETEINDLKIRLGGNLDPDTYQQDYDETLKRIEASVPKNNRGAAAYKLWLNKKIPGWQLDIDMARLARSDDNWDAEASAKIAGIKQGKDPNALSDFERFLARRQAFDPLDKTKAAKLLTDARNAQIEGQVAVLKTQALAGDTIKFQEAIEVIEKSNLPAEDKLIETNKIKRLQRTSLETAKDLIADKFFVALNEGTLKREDVIAAVRAGILERTVANGYINSLKNGDSIITDSVLKTNFILEISDFEQGKGNYRDIADRIQASMGTALHPNDAEQLLIRLTTARDKPDAEKNVREKFFRDRAKNLYTNNVFGNRKRKGVETAVKYFNVDERLRKFAVDNPDATDKEWESEWRAATGEETKNNIFQRVFDAIRVVSPVVTLFEMSQLNKQLKQRDRTASKAIQDIVNQGRKITISPPNKLRYEIGEVVVAKDGRLVKKISEGVWQPVQDF